ncbi:MAG: hypothetical protein H8E57_05595 [Candidatus Cloacimonetes bacterium]|nr:hypothetical protein [Candidatus Cloacimonadota bacterium]
MLNIIVGVVAFVLFFSIIAVAFTLKRVTSNKKKKTNVSCSGGCSVCKHN